jgi:hypothetical protein
MDYAANIGDAGMRRDMAAGLQDREEDSGRPSLDPAQG